MNESKPEIIELLLLVEQKYGKSLRTTTDFDEFSVHLKLQAGVIISTSTLKRLWGYVADVHKPRVLTLDLLARYAGFESFISYCQFLKMHSVCNSSFFTTKQLQAQNLEPGDEVEIGWAPNRYLRLLYQGDSWFEVLESKQSKLCKGDRFEAVCFLLGQPLSLAYVLRGEEKTAPFIAGRNGGLTLVNRLDHE